MLKKFLIASALTSTICCNSLNALRIENDTDKEVVVQAYLNSIKPGATGTIIYFNDPELHIPARGHFDINKDSLQRYTEGDPIRVNITELTLGGSHIGIPFSDSKTIFDQTIQASDFDQKTFKISG
ncbi:MAG: hypothetical protein K2Y08_05530 [Alphaproteobacteria bacterium]|nr:hypothetical protein [Alphaproteobacteria bacterium]